MANSILPFADSSEQRFITDPGLIEELEGSSYLVLRPTGEVLEKFLEVKRALQCVTKAGRYVGAPHVTLLNVAPGHSLDVLKQVVARWAAARSTLRIVVRKVEATQFGFPLATMVVEPSSPLTRSMASLRELANTTSLPYGREVAVDDWIFHISLLDYASVAPDEARAVAGLLNEYEAFSSTCTVGQAELVTYRNGAENSAGTFAFGQQD